MRFGYLFAGVSLLGSMSQAAETNATRGQDALCFAAIARHFVAAHGGPADEEKFANEMLRAEPYFAGKIRTSFTKC